MRVAPKRDKLLSATPANIYLFKINNKTLEKGVKYVQS